MRASPILAGTLALLAMAAWPAPAMAQVIVRGQGGGVLIVGG
ncbi:MAG: hypothetical protein WDN28_01565 [Chthoniobacter sp.]